MSRLGRNWKGFALWAVGGLLLSLSFFGMFSIGLFVLPFALVALAFLLARGRGYSAWGFLVGLAPFPLELAWINRHGPGQHCWSTATASGCDEFADPRPWLAFGLASLVLGTTAYLLARRRSAAGR